MNKMYSPTVYFFARIAAGMIMQVNIPILVTLIQFFGLGAQVSLYNFGMYFLTTF